MKLAIIGSRGLKVEDLKKYVPDDVTEIVSGGARGIDSQAADINFNRQHRSGFQDTAKSKAVSFTLI